MTKSGSPPATGMSRWRTADAIDYFGLPLEGTILMGSQVPI
jgi:hypothetical protein